MRAEGRERGSGRPTCEEGHLGEAALQLAQQDGEEAVFGQEAGILCALVIHHHFLLPAQVHLDTQTGVGCHRYTANMRIVVLNEDEGLHYRSTLQIHYSPGLSIAYATS